MKYLLIISLLLLSSCAVQPQNTSIADNKDVEVQLAFEKEGCKVYRFFEYGRPHYFAKCSDKK